MPGEAHPERRAPGPRRAPGGRRALDQAVLALAAACALLFAVDPLVEKHPYFEIENLWAFHGLCGIAAALVMVLVGRFLRLIVMRPEDYYDR